MSAPATGGAAVVLAVAFVWLFQPKPRVAPGEETVPEPPTDTVPAAPRTSAPAIEPPPPRASAAARPASSPPTPERAPLPGETPRTPMADLVNERQNMIRRAGSGGRGNEFPPDIAAVELEFGTEPVDRSWAPGAEAAVFAAFAEIPGLKLIDQQVECRSTMCRIELTQPGSAVTSGERAPFNMLGDSIGLTPRFMAMFGAGSTSTSMRSIGYFWREGFAPRQPPGEPRSN